MAKERDEKLKVTEKNSQYLRNEKQKISKSLDKERENTLSLERQVAALTEELNMKKKQINEYKQKAKSAEDKSKKQQIIAKESTNSKEEILQKLQKKSKEYKVQQSLYEKSKQSAKELTEKLENMRVWYP